IAADLRFHGRKSIGRRVQIGLCERDCLYELGRNAFRLLLAELLELLLELMTDGAGQSDGTLSVRVLELKIENLGLAKLSPFRRCELERVLERFDIFCGWPSRSLADRFRFSCFDERRFENP